MPVYVEELEPTYQIKHAIEEVKIDEDACKIVAVVGLGAASAIIGYLSYKVGSDVLGADTDYTLENTGWALYLTTSFQSGAWANRRRRRLQLQRRKMENELRDIGTLDL